MKLTLREWQELHTLQRAAKGTVDSLESRLTNLIVKHSQPSLDCPEVQLLNELLKRCDDASFQLSRIDVAPVDEWVGGDFSRWREPNCVLETARQGRRYFDDEGNPMN